MKNLIIALFITLSSLSLKAQGQFNGLWETSDNSYVTTFLACESEVLKVTNTNWTELSILEEKIIKQNKNKLITKIKNPANGYTTKVEYVLINNNTIEATYSAQPGFVYILKRLRCNYK